MKKFLFTLFGVALVLAACGGDEPAPAPVEPAPTEETAGGTFDATAAESTYNQSCRGCHGQPTEGGGVHATPLAGLSKEQILTAISEGPGTMSPNIISGADADNVAEWISAQ